MSFLRFLGRLLRPQSLLALLLFLPAMAYLATGFLPSRLGTAPPSIAPVVEIPREIAEVQLVMVGSDGIERTRFVELALPATEEGRLAGILEALREQLAGDGVWPPELPLPTVYTGVVARRRVAVLDFPSAEGAAATVDQERRLVRSLVATSRGAGIEALAFLRDGRLAPTLLGHVAVPGSL